MKTATELKSKYVSGTYNFNPCSHEDCNAGYKGDVGVISISIHAVMKTATIV